MSENATSTTLQMSSTISQLDRPEGKMKAMNPSEYTRMERIISYNDYPSNATKFSGEQIAILESAYGQDRNPTAKQLRKIAAQSGMTHLQCKAWFQYQRKKRKRHLQKCESEVLEVEIQRINTKLLELKENNAKLLEQNDDIRVNVDVLHTSVETIQTHVNNFVEYLNDIKDEDNANIAFHLSKQLEKSLTEDLEEIVAKRKLKAAPTTPTASTTNPLTSKGMGTSLSNSTMLQKSNSFKSSQSGFTSPSSLNINATDVPSAIVKRVAEQLSIASRLISQRLSGPKPTDCATTFHHPHAVEFRQLLSVHVDPMNVIDTVLNSISSIISDKHVADNVKDASLKPLLETYVRAETSAKHSRMILCAQVMAQLPLTPANVSNTAEVGMESMFCIFNQRYLGIGERSLCFMGDASVYALISNATDILGMEPASSLSVNDMMMLNKLQDALKVSEEILSSNFEAQWQMPYALSEQHYDPVINRHIQKAMSEMQLVESPHSYMVNTMLKASEKYNEGLRMCLELLPTLLAAKLIIACSNVKKLLIMSDSIQKQDTFKNF